MIYPCSHEFAAAWMNLGIVKAALNKTEVVLCMVCVSSIMLSS